jgi:peptide/nickel transport system permease protein
VSTQEGAALSIATASEPAATLEPQPTTFGRLILRRLLADRWAVAAAGFLIVLHLAALLAPWIASGVLHQSPFRTQVMEHVTVGGRTLDVVDNDGLPLGPNPRFPLGADPLGRDILTRILFGARVSLFVSTLGTLLAVAIGLLAGLLAGYYRGWMDTLVSRFADAMMAVPVLLLAIALAAVLREGSVWMVVLILALVNWTYLARLIRAETLSLRERDFVEAARALGARDRSVLLRHLVPNLTGPVIVFATLSMAGNILLESALSFLGVGIQPPTPSWGNMIQEGMALYNVAWWITLFPGLAILVTVVCYNMVGEALKAAIDPGGIERGTS